MSKKLVIGLCLAIALVVIGVVIINYLGQDPTEGATAAEVGEARGAEPVTIAEDDVVIPLDTNNTGLLFTGSSALGQQPGFFSDLGGQAVLTPDGELKLLQGTVQMDSVLTNADRLTSNLKNEPGFFEVEKYPTSEFVTTRIAPYEPGDASAADAESDEPPTHTIEGDLTLRGITRSIRFPATVNVTDEQLTLSSTFSVNRRDFGIDYEGGTAFPDIRDNVLINLDITADRPSASEAAPATTAPAGR